MELFGPYLEVPWKLESCAPKPIWEEESRRGFGTRLWDEIREMGLKMAASCITTKHSP